MFVIRVQLPKTIVSDKSRLASNTFHLATTIVKESSNSSLSLVDLTFYPWFERLPTLKEYRNFTLPADATRVQKWWDAVRDRPAVQSIENPVSFYLERYARFAVEPAIAGAAQK